MKKVILIGEETQLLNYIRKNTEIQIVDFKKYNFSNDNIIYQLENKNDFNKVSIVADLSENLHENLWGLFFAFDFLMKTNVEIDKVIFPYFPYSRSNHIHVGYTSSLFTIIKHLNQYEIGRIVTFDPHFESQQLPFVNSFKYIEQFHIFENILKDKDLEEYLFIGPDKGSEKRITCFKKIFSVEGFCFSKKRNNHNEKVEVRISENQEDLLRKAKQVAIFDDEICSGDTLKKVVDEIIKINHKMKVDVFVSHLYISEEHFMELSKKINICYATNSVHSDIKNTKLKIIDLSPFILEQFNV